MDENKISCGRLFDAPDPRESRSVIGGEPYRQRAYHRRVAAYVVVDIHRTDLERAARYSARSGPSVERHGGRFLARGGKTVTLEGGWDPDGWS